MDDVFVTFAVDICSVLLMVVSCRACMSTVSVLVVLMHTLKVDNIFLKLAMTFDKWSFIVEWQLLRIGAAIQWMSLFRIWREVRDGALALASVVRAVMLSYGWPWSLPTCNAKSLSRSVQDQMYECTRIKEITSIGQVFTLQSIFRK